MAMFKKEICAACGKEIGVLEKLRLADGNYLCDTCVGKCERNFAENFLKNHTYEEYLEYREHRKENREKVKQFNITDVFFDRIVLDRDKGWFIFGKKDQFLENYDLAGMNPEIFDAKDLVYFDFNYVIKSAKEGFFKDKVKADVIATIAFNNKWYPYAFHDKVLKNHKHSAELSRGIFGKSSITVNDEQEELEHYMLESLINNGIMIPHKLGKGLVFKVDLDPYAPYLDKLFELKQFGAIDSISLDEKLKNIAANGFVRRQIKQRFGRHKKFPSFIEKLKSTNSVSEKTSV